MSALLRLLKSPRYFLLRGSPLRKCPRVEQTEQCSCTFRRSSAFCPQFVLYRQFAGRSCGSQEAFPSTYLYSGRSAPYAAVACLSESSADAISSYSICRSFSFSASCCVNCRDAFSAIECRRR